MKKHPITLPLFSFTLAFAALSAHADTTWNGGASPDDDINNAANWSDGLPDNSGTNNGIINDGSTAEMEGRDDLDDKDFILSNSSTIHYADGISTFRWDDGSVTLNSGGIFDIDYTGTASIGHNTGTSATLNINAGGAADFAGGLAVGRNQLGYVNQTGGTMTVGGALNIAANASGSVPGSIYTLSGGSITAASYGAYHHNDPSKLNHFNFTVGSTGSLTITQDNYDFADLINDGEIRLNGNPNSLLENFNINTGVGGQTTLTVVPEPSTYALLAGLGVLSLTMLRRRIR